MHNFGVYASSNQFEFNGTNPVVLIGGMNGRGKTTFLEAVLLGYMVRILLHIQKVNTRRMVNI